MKYCLIIDDDEISRVFIGKYLSHLGIGFIQVSNIFDSLEMLKECYFDAIFLDLILDNEAGIEFLDLRDGFDFKTRSIPVIVTSFKADHASISLAIKKGADGYLIKPVLNKSLIKVLNNLNLIQEDWNNNEPAKHDDGIKSTETRENSTYPETGPDGQAARER